MSKVKSCWALKANVETVLERTETQATFWTLTFRKPHGPREAGAAWRKMGDRLRRLGFWGVRVLEWHPGDGGVSHGVHVHLVVGSQMPVETVRHLWAVCADGGRVHVRAAVARDASYLGKYLTKDKFRGSRAWSCWGTWPDDAPRSRAKSWEVVRDAVEEIVQGLVSAFRRRKDKHASWWCATEYLAEYRRRVRWGVNCGEWWESWGESPVAGWRVRWA